MAIASLGLRFVVELVGVGALAYWGTQASFGGLGRLTLAIAAPLALVAVWAAVVAPTAANGLTQPQKDAIGTVLLVLAAGALAAAGQRTAGLVFGAVVVANWALLVLSGERPTEVLR